MPAAINTSHLMAELKSAALAEGLKTTANDRDRLSGEIEAIKSKWWFGGRKAVYRMSCRLSESDHAVLFREAVVEKSWGLPPPTMTVETETVSGWNRSGTKTETSIGGGGIIEYERVRKAFENAVTQAGWHFRLEGGKMP
jgi:hypothetical protein